MGAHWVVGYLGAMVYYDHAHYMRVGGLGEIQKHVDVYPKLTTIPNGFTEKQPQRFE
jgi:hypothetical protein